MKRLKISLERLHAMQVTRIAVGKKKLVHAILTPKAVKYSWGRSRVVYIGTTKNGVSRVAESAAARSDKVLSIRGVNHFFVRIVTCSTQQSVKTWEKLERALILAFRQRYGGIPMCNKIGKSSKWRDELKYFKLERLNGILEGLE